MKTALLLLFFSVISLVSRGQSKQEEVLVQRVISAFEKDFNEGSFKNAAAYTTADWVHMNPGGGISRGREAVLQEVRSVHQAFLKGVSMQTESIRIRFITPQVAIGEVIHQMSPYELPKGVRHDKERQLKTYVVVKQEGKWLLSHDQNTIIKE